MKIIQWTVSKNWFWTMMNKYIENRYWSANTKCLKNILVSTGRFRIFILNTDEPFFFFLFEVKWFSVLDHANKKHLKTFLPFLQKPNLIFIRRWRNIKLMKIQLVLLHFWKEIWIGNYPIFNKFCRKQVKLKKCIEATVKN